MMCYRDRTYCSAYGDTCINHNCDRAVTEAVHAAAVKWWGSNEDAPIAYSDLSRVCTKKVEKK